MLIKWEQCIANCKYLQNIRAFISLTGNMLSHLYIYIYIYMYISLLTCPSITNTLLISFDSSIGYATSYCEKKKSSIITYNEIIYNTMLACHLFIIRCIVFVCKFKCYTNWRFYLISVYLFKCSAFFYHLISNVLVNSTSAVSPWLPHIRTKRLFYWIYTTW
jgi:hypothetical protein